MDGFDAEQIWLQLDQATVPLLKRVRKLLRKADSEPRLLLPNIEEDLEGGQTETCHLMLCWNLSACMQDCCCCLISSC